MVNLSVAKIKDSTKAELIILAEKTKPAKKKIDLASRVRELGRTAEALGAVAGATNYPATVILGRNLLHSQGDLSEQVLSGGKTIPFVNPHSGAQLEGSVVMIDNFGILTNSGPGAGGFAPPDDKFGTRVKGAVAGLKYNIRSSLTTKEGFQTSILPIIGYPIVGTGIRRIIGGAAKATKSLQRLTRRN